MFTIMFAVIHSALEIFWGALVRKTSQVTGIPSYRFAVPGTILAAIGWFFQDLTLIYTRHTNGESITVNTVIFAIGLFVMFFLVKVMKRAAAEAKLASESTTPMLSWVNEQLSMWRIVSSAWAMGRIIHFAVLAVTGNYTFHQNVSAISWTAAAFSAWAVYVNDRGGKSLFAKTKNKVKTLVLNMSGVLSPAPTPV